jgi:hypothetical protein
MCAGQRWQSVQAKVQLRAGESEWVNPASAMKPQVALRMPRASAWRIWRGTVLL